MTNRQWLIWKLIDMSDEEGHTLPDRWGYGRTTDIHLCPECCKRMGKEG